jgi:hypothetical protein
MRILIYPLYAICSWVITLTAYICAPLIALSVDANGNLPRLLKYFQTPDAPCWGADFWATDNPTYSKYWMIVTCSKYWMIVTWLWRNPAQGFDQSVKAKVTAHTPVTVKGNLLIKDTSPSISGWFLITGGGYFQLSWIWPTKYVTFVSHSGWNLEPIAKKYEHTTLGALKATPLRFYIGKR